MLQFYIESNIDSRHVKWNVICIYINIFITVDGIYKGQSLLNVL